MRIVGEADIARAVGRYGDAQPRVVVAGNFATPGELLALVDAALPAYRLFMLNAQGTLPDREGVVLETPFVGPGMRRSPRLSYLPARLSLVPRLFSQTHPPDVVLLHTTLPRDGRVSLGIEVNILPAAIEQARRHGGVVIAQLNPQMPWTRGDAELSVESVDLALEVDVPLLTPPPRSPGAVEAEIGRRVAGLVLDGATVQIGIGGVPDATLAALPARRGLRVWSEMFSDGVLRLEQAGALDRDAELVASFLFGSRELYDWVDRNPRVRVLRTETTNDPARIAQQHRMTSVNSALQVDLFGQANGCWAARHIHSGLGGQSDFVVGALHAQEGLAVLALPSWHPKADCSTVVPVLDGPATSFQHSWVVTEQGAARIWPGTQCEQARHLIAVAHPDARDDLEKQAEALGVLR